MNRKMFWGNYMDVFNPAGSGASRQLDGFDVFPFLRRLDGEKQTYEAEVRQAQEYGLDGFQVWPDYGHAARWLDMLEDMDLERMFYIIPQLGAAPAQKKYTDFEIFAGATLEFLDKYHDHPHLYQIDGRPVLSSWGWHEESLGQIDRLRERMKSAGHEFLWIPTVNTRFPEELAYEKYDGYNSWNPYDGMEYKSFIEKAEARASQIERKFILAGSIKPGYDSGNRMFEAFRLFCHGTRRLINSLRAIRDTDVPWAILVTWNDVSETASYPSWRSPGGYREIISFFRQVCDHGESRLGKTKAVVSYMPDQLLGDDIEVQFALLPEGGSSPAEWSGVLELRDLSDNVVFKQSLDRTIEHKDDALIVNCRFPGTDLGPEQFVLVPYVGENDGAETRMRRLQPIHIRHGRLRTYSPLAISLDDVAPDTEIQIKLSELKKGELESLPESFYSEGVFSPHPLFCSYRAFSPSAAFDQIQIADGMQVLHDLRQPASEKTVVFLAIDNWGFSKELKVEVSGEDGALVRWVARKHMDSSEILRTADSRRVSVRIDRENVIGHKPEITAALIAIEAGDISKVKLKITHPELKKKSVSVPLADLAVRPLLLAGEKEPDAIRLRLAEDGCALQLAPRLGVAEASADVLLPVVEHNERVRVVHAQAVLEGEKVYYSRPFAWVRNTGGEMLGCQVIHSEGTYDDFTHKERLDVPSGPYDKGRIKQLTLPDYRVPHNRLSFDEGMGWYVNHGGCFTTLGWGWIYSRAHRTQGFTPPGEKDPRWEHSEALFGSAIRMKRTSRMRLRSRSLLGGAFTVSMWLMPDEFEGRSQRLLSNVKENQGYGPLVIHIGGTGKVEVNRDVMYEKKEDSLFSEGKIEAGRWNHLAVTYDFDKICIYLNGRLSGSMTVPAYIVRSHSKPFFGALTGEKADGYEGLIDEVDFIWRALSADEIEKLFSLRKNDV